MTLITTPSVYIVLEPLYAFYIEMLLTIRLLGIRWDQVQQPNDILRHMMRVTPWLTLQTVLLIRELIGCPALRKAFLVLLMRLFALDETPVMRQQVAAHPLVTKYEWTGFLARYNAREWLYGTP